MKRTDDVQSYPLAWPDGWKRTPDFNRAQSHPFGSRLAFDRARRGLREELQRLGASTITLSTNVPLRQDGEPHSGAAGRRMDDPGVAIYFMLKGKPLVMAQDRYRDVAANMRSLALAVEGMRQLERHGGGTMMERAFSGFAALPPPDGVKPRRPWWEVLRYPVDPAERELLSAGEVEARFRTLAKKLHPDVGGSAEAFSELERAKADAIAELTGETA